MSGVKVLLKKTAQPLIKVSWLCLPLKLRQQLSKWIGRQLWLPGCSWLAMQIIRDWADADPNAYNRFLWVNHVGFATDFEQANDFGPENLTQTRILLFDHLIDCLRLNNIDPSEEIRRIFDVGCSSGFLLRHMETTVFPSASVLEGLDIDCHAIETGMTYLAQNGSRIRIFCADMADLDRVMGDKRYDLILCTGVLMYLNQVDAGRVVRSMLDHADKLVVIASRAHPVADNVSMSSSVLREDGTLIHNVEAMVKQAGGKIHFKRWEGDQLVNGYSVYFIFCSRAAAKS